MGLQRLISGLMELSVILKGMPVPSGDCWLVGGALRDAWLGRELHDIDIVAPEPLNELIASIESFCGKRAYTVNQRFASSRIMMDDVVIDITPLHPDGIVADLHRRDYCINAMAVPLSRVLDGNVEARDVIADPNALEDLEHGMLRLVSAAALSDDPLRVLRGFRLAAQLGMEPDAGCRAAWRIHATDLSRVSGERQREELLRWFGLESMDTELLRICADSGVLWQLFPALSNSVGCEQNVYHHLDVWQHTILAIEEFDRLLTELPPGLQEYEQAIRESMDGHVEGGFSRLALTRLALLLHDVGKPATRAVDPDGNVSFIGHQKIGVDLVEEDFLRLRFSTAEQDFLRIMIHEHLRLGFYCSHEPLPAKLIYRFIRTMGEATLPQLVHSLADCAAAKGEGSSESLARHIQAAQQIADNYINGSKIARPPVLLNGRQIMQLLDQRPGPIIGKYKRAMLEATAEGLISTPDEAREYITGLAGNVSEPETAD